MAEVQLPLHILFIFLDGVGLGQDNPDTNPFSFLPLPHFQRLGNQQSWTESSIPVLTSQHVFKHIDAKLEMPGLPQSGTGQASLFTGINCAQIAGKHFGPFPHSKTRPTIARNNIFQQVNQLNLLHPEASAFANAYPHQFFEKARAKNRWTVTTLSCIEANVGIRTLDELQNNQALTADITRNAWRTHLSIPVNPINEHTAAEHLAQISRSHPFTLYEYYLTDKAGHSQSIPTATRILESLDALIEGLLAEVDFDNTLLLLTSDHGNIEDLSTKSHTLYDVPLVAYGKGAHHFQKAESLLDITPMILNALLDENKSSLKTMTPD